MEVRLPKLHQYGGSDGGPALASSLVPPYILARNVTLRNCLVQKELGGFLTKKLQGLHTNRWRANGAGNFQVDHLVGKKLRRLHQQSHRRRYDQCNSRCQQGDGTSLGIELAG